MKTKIPSWAIGISVVIALAVLSLLIMGLVWGSMVQCLPCQSGWDVACILKYEICSIFHDLGYFLLAGFSFLVILSVVLGASYLALGEDAFLKVFGILFFFALAGLLMFLVLVDLFANILNAIPYIGVIAETLGETVLETLKMVCVVLMNVVAFVLGGRFLTEQEMKRLR